MGSDPDLDALIDGKRAIWPIRENGTWGRWRNAGAKMRDLIGLGFVRVGQDNVERRTRVVYYVSEHLRTKLASGDVEIAGRDEHGAAILANKTVPRTAIKTVWHRVRHNAAMSGSQLLLAFMGKQATFSFPKSVYAVRDTLEILTRNNPNALILDFFAGSGTTLHSTMLLNAQDGGHRRCFLVTNNEVKAKTAVSLNKDGFFRGDPEFEAAGVFEGACKPRITAAVTGLRPDGTPVPGDYFDGRRYADGFEENVEFFRLDYLDAGEVEFGLRFRELHPLLWLWAGGVGHIEDLDTTRPLGAPTMSPYAVLFDPSGMPALLEHLAQRPDVTHVFVAAESDDGFDQLSAELAPTGVKTVCLYRDYLAPLRRSMR